MARTRPKPKMASALLVALILAIVSVAQVGAAPAYHGGSSHQSKRHQSNTSIHQKAKAPKHHSVAKKHVKKAKKSVAKARSYGHSKYQKPSHGYQMKYKAQKGYHKAKTARW